ncbi:MAG: DUF6064 family protein [Gammaproteobacteria bacterium]|nr:DUF6064 family protein [Gammaproteobacteria bacterium]
MNLPFTREQFFEVFAVYNTAVWPAPFLLGVLAILLLVLVLGIPGKAGRAVSFGLAFLWAWLSIAYHLTFFWEVNPAAPLFAAISLGAAIAFAWTGGIRGQLQFERAMSFRVVLGLAVALFALLGYPLIGEFLGHRYPATPTFGLPCPTTIFTFGLLLMAKSNLPRILVVGPLVWAFIGAFAAFSLGVRQDLALVLMVVLGLYLLLQGIRSGHPGGIQT